MKKCYSDFDSEEEIVKEESRTYIPHLSYEPDLHSGGNSSSRRSTSDSSSEESSGSSGKKKRKSKKVKKSGASDKVTMEQHETDMGKLQNSVLYRIEAMEDKVEAMEDKFETEKKNLVNHFEEQIR